MLLPQPATTKQRRGSRPLLTLFVILILIFLPPPSNTPHHPSRFTARVQPHTYSTYRRFSTYPFGKLCSPPARQHFITRLTRPTRPLAPLAPPNISVSRNRVLLSTSPHNIGDDLGHRACMLNYEHQLAMMLSITYTHRKSAYGSLTRRDLAIEQLFNWESGELTRQQILDDGCEEIRYINDTCEIPSTNIICKRVKSRSRGGLFDQSVFIPSSVSACLLGRHVDVDMDCLAVVRAFTAAYPQENTLFQTYPDRCFRDWVSTNFTTSRDWFRQKYWSGDVATGMDARKVQVAVHVRRGDIFNYTNRVLISDDTCADLLWRVKHALDEIVGRDVPIDVHLYSEGLARGRNKNVHDTATMESLYVDHQGIVRDEGHWERLLRKHRSAGRGNLRVFTHTAQDTIRSVRGMIAADVFIGSASELSIQVVRVLGRGVMMLPVWEGEVGDELVVPYDWARNGFDSFLNERVLYEALAEVVRRNRLACSVL